MLIVISLTVLAGLLGGLGNWFISATPTADAVANQKPVSTGWQLLSCLTLGLIAAALIPLFLSMAKSDLVATASGAVEAGKPNEPNKTLGADRMVYFGFCLVAAVTSRSFIDTVSARALRLAGENEQRVASLNREMKEIASDKEEPEANAQNAKSRSLNEAPMDTKSKVLYALVSHPKYTRRNATGLHQDSGVPLIEVNLLLEQLRLEGLVEPKTSTDGRTLWVATPRGRALAN